jgi:hypothetical protein
LATINIDSKILEALQLSTCFGIAHDESTPECKQCDVKGQCKVKSEGGLNIPTPTAKPKSETKVTETAKPKATKTSTKPASKPATASKPAAKTTPTPKPKATVKPPSGDAPDFKPMTLDELKSLAEERKVEWKDYGNDQITRMRLIMVLKKSY